MTYVYRDIDMKVTASCPFANAGAFASNSDSVFDCTCHTGCALLDVDEHPQSTPDDGRRKCVCGLVTRKVRPNWTMED